MNEPTITPEQVMAAGCKRPDVAQRIATYANRRAAGDRKTDAGRGLDVNPETLGRYEKWANAIRRSMGLPNLTKSHSPIFASRERYAQGGQSGAHMAQHVGRGVVSPDCPLCQGGVV